MNKANWTIWLKWHYIDFWSRLFLYFRDLDLYYTTENNFGTQSCAKAKTVDPIWWRVRWKGEFIRVITFSGYCLYHKQDNWVLKLCFLNILIHASTRIHHSIDIQFFTAKCQIIDAIRIYLSDVFVPLFICIVQTSTSHNYFDSLTSHELWSQSD